MSDKEKDDNVIEFCRKPMQGNKEKKRSARRQLPPFGYFASRSCLPRSPKPGQIIAFKIVSIEPGGYTLSTLPDGLPGYLASNAMHKVDDQLLGTFICIDKNQLLLSELFNHEAGDLVRRTLKPVSNEDTTED